MRFTVKELTKIILFSAIGAILSVPIGHLGNYLKIIPLLPLGVGQILAGLHLIMVALTALSLKKPWAATVTGVLKGLLEAFLFSFHGVPVIVMSGIQGSVIDSLMYVFGYNSRIGLIFGCGLAALSNVLFIQFFLRLPFPPSVYTLMYILSFISGVTLGAYLSRLLYQMIETRI